MHFKKIFWLQPKKVPTDFSERAVEARKAKVMAVSGGLELNITKEFSPPHPWAGVMHCETYVDYQPKEDPERYTRVWQGLGYIHFTVETVNPTASTTSSPVLKSPPIQ